MKHETSMSWSVPRLFVLFRLYSDSKYNFCTVHVLHLQILEAVENSTLSVTVLVQGGEHRPLSDSEAFNITNGL